MALQAIHLRCHVIVMWIRREIFGSLCNCLERFMAGKALIGLNGFLCAFRVTALAFKAGGLMPVG
jgi:hypothetical protein